MPGCERQFWAGESVMRTGKVIFMFDYLFCISFGVFIWENVLGWKFQVMQETLAWGSLDWTLFWYGADVAVCIFLRVCMHVHVLVYTQVCTYICKRQENWRKQTDCKGNWSLLGFVCRQLLNNHLKQAKYEMKLHFPYLW